VLFLFPLLLRMLLLAVCACCREFFTADKTGVFKQAPCTRPMHETMATDPSFMVDMMKKNLTGTHSLYDICMM
jgi:hypothetical protein